MGVYGPRFSCASVRIRSSSTSTTSAISTTGVGTQGLAVEHGGCPQQVDVRVPFAVRAVQAVHVWLILKDKGKFNGGIPVGSSAPKRTKNTAAGDYTSSGPSPVDLNAEPEGSSGTPTSTFRRPIGTKAAKAQAKGKAKAGASGSAAPPQAAPALFSSWTGRSRSSEVIARWLSIGLYLTPKTAFVKKPIRKPDRGLRI